MKLTPDLPDQPEQLDLPKGWSIDYRDSTTIFTPPEGKVIFGQQPGEQRTINELLKDHQPNYTGYETYSQYPVVDFSFKQAWH
jgi:hypothetical protein